MVSLLTLSAPTSFFYRIEFVIFRTAISNPANIYLFKVNNRKTRKRCEICSKLTMKIPERRPDVVLVFLLLILNIFHTFFLFFYWWLLTSKCFLGNSSKFLNRWFIPYPSYYVYSDSKMRRFVKGSVSVTNF